MQAGTIEVYSEPQGGVYRELVTYRGGQSIRLVRIPEVEVAVGDVLG